MLPRKRLFVLIALGVLGVLLALATRLADPRVHALYHLRRVAPAEVTLDSGSVKTTGHAAALVANGEAEEVLPELLAFARDEAARDDAACFRPLVIEVYSRPLILPQGKLPPFALEVCVGCLRSRDAKLRVHVLSRLPTDPRVFEAVLEHGEHIIGDAADPNAVEPRRVAAWLREFAVENGARLGLGHTLDRFLSRQRVPDDDLDELIPLMRARYDRHRPEFPPQIGVR